MEIGVGFQMRPSAAARIAHHWQSGPCCGGTGETAVATAARNVDSTHASDPT